MATTDPRRRETGTTLTAEGSVTPPQVGSEIGSSTPGIIRETIPDLGTSLRRIQTFDVMMNNDSTVDVSVRSAKVPVLGAQFYFDPFSDSQDHVDQAEFAYFNLIQATVTPWLQVLEEALRMIEYGYAVMEPVYELREWAPKRFKANRRKYTMLRKLGARPASTIMEFQYDDQGGPAGIKQRAIRADGQPDEVEIPIDKLIIFTYNKKGGNLEGRSALRTSYKHWYYKDNLYKIDGIQKERHGIGIPKAVLGPGSSDNDKKAARALVRGLRTNEEAGIVTPDTVDIGFAKPEGELVPIMESIEHHDAHIALNLFAQFLLLGIQGGGGRATSGSQLDMFLKALRYLANFVCETFNLYIVPKLIGFNFETDQFPKLRVRNVGEQKDMQMWASAMARLAAQNLITLDIETEQWVREIIDAPKKLGGKQTPDANANSMGAFGKTQTSGQTGGQGNTEKGAEPDQSAA